jgi:hypothetical protein
MKHELDYNGKIYTFKISSDNDSCRECIAVNDCHRNSKIERFCESIDNFEDNDIYHCVSIEESEIDN